MWLKDPLAAVSTHWHTVNKWDPNQNRSEFYDYVYKMGSDLRENPKSYEMDNHLGISALSENQMAQDKLQVEDTELSIGQQLDNGNDEMSSLKFGL